MTSKESSIGSSVVLSERSLKVEMPPQLLRGVYLHQCLGGWGRHWASADPAEQACDFRLSRPTQRIDNFLSHDWKTSRWLKLAALLVVFNSRAAAVATLLVSVSVGILRASSVLPDEAWTVALGHVTFFSVFFGWQRLRSFCRPRTVFLDKLCIAQHDAALKEQGILGLAAFLDIADELTVLWSPRTLQRLWCVYEISTFLRKPEKRKQVHIIPVKLALMLCVNSLSWFVMAGGYSVIANTSGREVSWARTLLGSLCMCFAAVLFPWTYYVGIGMMEDLSTLPQQLSNFRIQDAESMCCSRQHVHPETQQDVPCDRELVFATLQQWFGRAGDAPGKHLTDFNRLVRKELAPSVLKSVGRDHLPVWYTLYMAVSGSTPFLSDCISLLAKGPPGNLSSGGTVIWGIRTFISFAYVPVLAVLATRLNLCFCWHGFRMAHHSACRSRFCVAVLLSQLGIIIVATFWALFFIPSSQVEASSWIPIVPFLLLLAATATLFRNGCMPDGETSSESAAATSRKERLEPLQSGVPNNGQKRGDEEESTFEV
ncbi:unnamed protein product [Symbiodinium necroappetens]|uniref:Transmembrane protein n=1 Tax=Symbiodinium necroappetens TaxID=1628268 RepID=A0A813AIV1_9DINO|nr:unnamed protein product [Symbiodinium necroappetens]